MVGSLIGPYRIIETLGEGGMGVVYRAQQLGSEHQVALKTVKALAPTWVHGIRREIQALNRISHPGIVRILNHGVFDGRPWYAMALLEGESLRRRISRMWSPYESIFPTAVSTEVVSETESLVAASSASDRPSVKGGGENRTAWTKSLPPAGAGELPLVISVVRRICETLSFMHGEGFINCDLKPENIVLVDGHPVIIDFGLSAYHPDGIGRESLEPMPGRAGTRLYMSPEQRRGERVDARSDLYSVGCILHEMIVGNSPVRVAADAPELPGRLVPLSDLVTGVPQALENIVIKLLREDVADRFGYADEVTAELDRLGCDVEIRDGQSSLPPARPYLYRARFVGRTDLMDRLDSLRVAAAGGTGAVAVLGGESGVGKTRVAMELARRVPRSQMRVLMTDVTPNAADEAGPPRAAPLQALRPPLDAVAERCAQGGPTVTERILGNRRDILAPYAPALAELPRAQSGPALVTLGPEAGRRRLFGALADTIGNFAAERPLFWVLDDLGWADELSLSFLQSLTPEFLARTPVLLLASYRIEEPSEGVEALLKKEHVVSLAVPRLDTTAVRSMAGDMMAMRNPPDGFVQFVEGQAEGNPLFVAEYVRAAVADGVLFRTGGRSWTLAGDAAAPSFANLLFPRPLRELVERRIRALSPAAQTMASAAAVLGRLSEVDSLYEVAGLDEAMAISALDELLRRQVLEPMTAGSIRFAHDKLREVTYGLAASEKRQELHSRAAIAIEQRLGGSADPSGAWAVLGHHFAAAGEAVPAVRYLKMAADHARSIYANTDAIRLYEEAAAQVRSLLADRSTDGKTDWSELHAKLHESRGDVLSLIGRRDEARQAYDLALLGADEAPAARSRLLRKQGRTWETHHRHAEALDFYGRAQAALSIDPAVAGLEERDEWIQVRIDQLWVHYWLNHVAEMDALVEALNPVVTQYGSPAQRTRFYNTQTLRNLRRDSYYVADETLGLAVSAIEACKAGVGPAEAYMAQVTYGLVLLLHDSLEACHDELMSALTFSRRAGDAPQQARCLTYITVAARRRGSLAETEEYVAQSMEASLESGMKEYIAAARANQAWICLQKGDVPGAQARAREALGDWKLLPAAFPFRWMALVPLLEAALIAGDLDEAISCTGGLLAPGQQRLPGPVQTALREAFEVAKASSSSAARPALDRALQSLAEARLR